MYFTLKSFRYRTLISFSVIRDLILFYSNQNGNLLPLLKYISCLSTKAMHAFANLTEFRILILLNELLILNLEYPVISHVD